MKTRVIIESGLTTVELTPENAFDTDVLDKVKDNNSRYTLEATVTADDSYGVRKNRRLVVKIVEV